jgi:hypothetical protein
MVDTMDLSQITARYRSIYGGFESWEQLLEEVQANPFEARALELLAADLQAAGSFREPVVLGIEEEREEEPEDFEAEDDLEAERPTYAAVLDGTKRVLAHLLTGISEVKVKDLGETPFVLGGDMDRYYVSTSVEFDLPLVNEREALLSVPAQPVDQQAELDLWDGLLSLRVTDDVWLSVLTSGSQHKGESLRYSMTWDSKAISVSKDEIKAALLAQLEAFGFDTSGTRVDTKIEDWAQDAPIEVEQTTLHNLVSGFGDPTA